MSNYQYSQDLINDALSRGGEPTDGTSDYANTIITYLNRAYQALYSGGNELDGNVQELWWWLRKATPGVIIINPAIDLLIGVTNGLATATLTATYPTSLVGYFARVPGIYGIYRISAHIAGTDAVTFDSIYTDVTNPSMLMNFAPLEYDLPTDCLSIMSPMRTYRDDVNEINGIELRELDRNYPLINTSAFTPRQFAMVTESKVRFSSSPATQIRVDFDYAARPATLTGGALEEPIVPLEYRRLLADHMTFLLHTDKEDSRAGDAAVLAKATLKAMQKEHRRRLVNFSSSYGRIFSRAGQRAEQQGPVRTAAGLIIGY